MKARFYVVATPIGNLEDITLRALRILTEVDVILAEDTRVTAKLLAKHEIKKPILSYHQHSETSRAEHVIELLGEGKHIALVSDAGTPGINDPGGKLIEEILSSGVEVDIVPIPGPNALISTLSVSGFPADQFIFMGFPPHKKGRNTFFQNISESAITTAFYESPLRILKALKELPHNREVVIGRELTKQFETFYRGKAGEIQIPKDQIKGEFVVIVRGK